MREKTSFCSKMMDRNWVTKRKRKRLSCGSDLSNGKESASVPSEFTMDNPPAKRRVKSDSNFAGSPHKKKGNDGYYYECVVCDMGGNLLCCDSCPRTYHLQCLNPPLKRTPPGKWQCPKCFEANGSSKSIGDPESLYKRERTKITVQRSKIDTKSSVSDKVSGILESSILGKDRSSSKGKPTISRQVPSTEKNTDSSQTGASCRTKSINLSYGETVEGALPCANDETEKKPKVSYTDTSGNRTQGSPTKKVQSCEKILNLEPNGEPSDWKPGLPCNAESPKTRHDHPLICTSQKVKKRKKKLVKDGTQKKSKGDRGKCSVKTSVKCGDKPTSSPEASKPCLHCNSVDHQVSVSPPKEDFGAKPSGVQQKDKYPEERSLSSNELYELGFAGDKAMTREENSLVEVQQVHRILGCRVQIQPDACLAFPMNVAKHISSRDTSGMRTFVDTEDHVDILDQTPHNKVVDAQGSCFALNQTDMDRNAGNNTKVDKLHVYKRCSIKKCVDGNTLGSTGKYFKDVSPSNASGEAYNDPNTDDMENITDSVIPVKSTGVECANLSIHCNNSVPDTSQTPYCCDENKGDLGVVMSLNSIENKIEPVVEDSTPALDEDTTKYEFLVKWMGQSHIHNSWVSEAKLKVLAKRKLENYKAKYGTAVINIFQEEWSQPQRVIALRATKNGTIVAFVKWCGLPYDECTWENLNEPVIEKSSHLITEFQQFERQALDSDASKNDIVKNKSDRQQSEIASLSEQPKELKGGSLFPHQLEALNWLRRCWHRSKNVILADEMGLGKTVSACAFISSLYVEFKVKLPCLVLVPLSTMPNWLSEFALWAPDLNVVEYHGSSKARSQIRQFEWHASYPEGVNKRTKSYKFNVLLTTYEMVIHDSSHLRGVQWELLIVDEGHRLKNSGSKLFSLLNTISFQHRVLLTGTPLQNNIGEMFNLLYFLQPASFPSLSSFEEKFNDLTSAERVEELKKLVAPHMLRRLKKDVMKNIPPKTEHLVPVELSTIQAEYYRAMMTKNYQILRNIGKGVAQQSMLNIVMQLRKVCNHPYLIPGTEPEAGSVEFLQEMRIKASAKLTLLHAMLKLLNKEGHRVLIFSQMTKLLDILEDYLTVEFGPKTFERVDGSVSVADRRAAIARFNQDKSRFVFLLSTRSCGLGINLATADTVIIYDSDFNPHADIQAMNRAHRIGQSNKLLVYRLVVRASVEERILQLAKKKLMLDQLFVNKSESQKEVEDILRWGTEELFSDSAVNEKDNAENSSSKDEAITEVVHKNKRRAGGLGDVYQDKCTDGSTKVTWDENAILRLLDRSVLQSGSSESPEGDLDNDMLGSVKSLEWNDELTDEHGKTEILPIVVNDVCGESSERKEDSMLGGSEENEWDRLLRVRWEKHQRMEEAVLGRGKRLRKAVSYNEAFAPHPVETLNEGGHEEEEPAPEREYTPAGRALKEKFGKLRARQKERLTRRNMVKGSVLTGDHLGPMKPPQYPTTETNVAEHMSKPEQTVRPQTKEVDLMENRINHPSDAPEHKSNPTSRVASFSKKFYKGNLSSHLDLSVIPPFFPTDICTLKNLSASTSNTNSVTTSSLLPVLGLCAPNANQHESAQRSMQESFNPPRSNFGPSRTGKALAEFPFHLAPGFGSSGDMSRKGKEVAGDASKLLDTPPDVSQHRFKSSNPDISFPFSSYPLTNTLRRGPDSNADAGAAIPAFRGKMALPNFTFEEHTSKHYADLFPSLSLGTNVDCTNQDFRTMPLFPNFRLLAQDIPKHNQHMREVPPALGPGPMQSTYFSLPENHKKVLDNIMMRTGFGATNSFRKRPKVHAWSEDELDALWIGVRRHGKGNWDAMLKNPRLKFSKYRTSEDLSVRWDEEQVKILEEATRSVPKLAKSTFTSGISDEMMTRAMVGSKLAGLAPDCSTPFELPTHLTDMHLGHGDLKSGLLPVDPSDQFSFVNERYEPHRPWNSDDFRDFSARPSDRPVTSSNSHFEQQFLLNSFASNNLSSMGMNHSTSCELQQKDELRTNKYVKLPSSLDRSLNFFHDSHNNMRSGEPTSTRLLSDPNKELDYVRSVKYDATGSSSTVNKLPHWLRDAVSVPARPPEADLPPTVSAIAHSVRLLYGEQRPTIPPFTAPGPPPSLPRDPRRSLKKKSKMHKSKRMAQHIATSSKSVENTVVGEVASGSILMAPPLPPSNARMPAFPWIDPNPDLACLNLNAMASQSSSYLRHLKKQGAGMCPSPEVLELVESCVGPGASISEPPLPKALEVGGEVKEKEVQGCLGEVEERKEESESADSSKTQSDVGQMGHGEEAEISSEGTVSDDHVSQQEA